MFDLSLEMLRVVEEAAIASARTMGMGDPKAADHAAVPLVASLSTGASH
jgi:fructose-1,6-bisphosphatase/sedoheptulose 1,7-bisphosphatase-like protein